MSYSEGDLVKDQSTSAIYLIECGTRRRIPDSATLESRWSWDQVRNLPNAQVDAIPMGVTIPSVRRIEATVETRLDTGRFMRTGANLMSDGRLTAFTRTWTLELFGSFSGMVQVVMGDANGVAIGTTRPQYFAVDGTGVHGPLAPGASDRTVNWSEDIDPAIANRTASLTITHAWESRVNIEEMVRSGIEGGKFVWEIIQELEQEGFAGGGTGASSPPL